MSKRLSIGYMLKMNFGEKPDERLGLKAKMSREEFEKEVHDYMEMTKKRDISAKVNKENADLLTYLKTRKNRWEKYT